MKLKILLPTEILVEQEALNITAEAGNGSFSLLPRHVDFATALVPGILSFIRPDGGEESLAVDEGVLVKNGDEVLVSVRHAVRGGQLGQLRQAVADQFEQLDDHERKSRSVVARLEAQMVRRFLDLQRHG